MPIRYSQPIRRAAALAAIRISDYVKADNANSDSDESVTTTATSNSRFTQTVDGLTRARKNGYDDTLYVMKYLLSESDSTKKSEEKVQLAEKMFGILIKNPNILIYEPKFRLAVVNKMKEFDELIKTRVDNFHKAEYDKAIKMMKLSMMSHVRNTNMLDKIYTHLNAVSDILNDYKGWAKNTTLRLSFDTLTTILETIKKHPNYVVDHIQC
jgi:hypothetical protein